MRNASLTRCARSQLSLAHFCENDGPTSILCTQVLPVSCLNCYPLPSVSSSIGDLAADAPNREQDDESAQTSHGRSLEVAERFNRDAFNTIKDNDISRLHLDGATHLQSPTSPTSSSNSFEKMRHKPYDVPSDGGGCVSCTISIPSTISSKLPSGAPGSPRIGGGGRNGSPILRSKWAVPASPSQQWSFDGDDDISFPQSSPESFASGSSRSSDHTHTLTYLTTSSPVESNTYSLLRRACIRTLSCEQLPRGLTCGPLSFGDPIAGYTIAYKFRLPDPHARGRQRYYALLALAGQDPGRSFKAMPVIWRAFERIAAGIMANTESAILKDKTNEVDTIESKNAIPVSSFLTGRTMDPDGYPRRNGAANMRARGLAEMVGDELFFARLHKDFVHLLQILGRQFGGMRVEAPILDGGVRGLYDESHDDVAYHHNDKAATQDDA